MRKGAHCVQIQHSFGYISTYDDGVSILIHLSSQHFSRIGLLSQRRRLYDLYMYISSLSQCEAPNIQTGELVFTIHYGSNRFLESRSLGISFRPEAGFRL